jgi:flagellar biosynthesis anti-sigma factor FlgM
MTSSIGSLGAGQNAGVVAGETSPSGAGAIAAPADAADVAAGGATGGEAVTVSADAQTTAQLLDAARGADGIDTARVAQLRSAIQGGSYNVSPDDLAKAIISATQGGGAIAGGPS